MKNKKLLSIILGVLLLPVFGNAILASGRWEYGEGSSSRYHIKQLKSGWAESLVEYDYGTWMPNDDAYMKGYASSIGYNYVSVEISGQNRYDHEVWSERGKMVYMVAELSGVDHADSAYGVATSNAGTTALRIYK